MRPKRTILQTNDGLLRIGGLLPFKDAVTGEPFMAELIAVIEDGVKEYALFNIPNKDDTSDLFALYIVKNEDGRDDFEEIDDQADLIRMQKFVLSLLCKENPRYLMQVREKALEQMDELIDLLDGGWMS